MLRSPASKYGDQEHYRRLESPTTVSSCIPNLHFRKAKTDSIYRALQLLLKAEQESEGGQRYQSLAFGPGDIIAASHGGTLHFLDAKRGTLLEQIEVSVQVVDMHISCKQGSPQLGISHEMYQASPKQPFLCYVLLYTNYASISQETFQA